MNRMIVILLVITAFSAFGQGDVYRYYGAHVTAQEPWINRIVVYNNGDLDGNFEITIFGSDGQAVWNQVYMAPANSSVALVLSNFPGYVPSPDEVELTPVEGTFMIETENPKLRPKLSYRFGDSLSLTEFFLQETLAREYILPNTIQAHFSWTGVALMNPHNHLIVVELTAYQDGNLRGQAFMDVNPLTKFVSLSEWIWPGLGYIDFDQVRIACDSDNLPPPMSITGNDAQDRHVFFNAAVTEAEPQTCGEAGALYEIDSIVGNMRCVPAGSFIQGSPDTEPCRGGDETQFEHTLTQDMVVMETEASRQMWADLKALQPDLPVDPTTCGGMNNPVQDVFWYEILLFANLLSTQQGFTPCYYTDSSMSALIEASNYAGGNYYCNFNADGFRLPTEGEWEYFCRGGTATPFSVDVPDYASGNCSNCESGTFPNLEAVAYFCAYSISCPEPVGQLLPNLWGLKDVHGNIYEWCWDWYADYPVGPVTDYRGPEIGTYRTQHGGGFNAYPSYCRSAYRGWWLQDYRLDDSGFRLVRTIR